MNREVLGSYPLQITGYVLIFYPDTMQQKNVSV